MLSLLSRYVKNFKYPYIERLFILEPMNFSSNNLMKVEKCDFMKSSTIFRVLSIFLQLINLFELYPPFLNLT